MRARRRVVGPHPEGTHTTCFDLYLSLKTNGRLVGGLLCPVPPLKYLPAIFIMCFESKMSMRGFIRVVRTTAHFIRYLSPACALAPRASQRFNAFSHGIIHYTIKTFTSSLLHVSITHDYFLASDQSQISLWAELPRSKLVKIRWKKLKIKILLVLWCLKVIFN